MTECSVSLCAAADRVIPSSFCAVDNGLGCGEQLIALLPVMYLIVKNLHLMDEKMAETVIQ